MWLWCVLGEVDFVVDGVVDLVVVVVVSLVVVERLLLVMLLVPAVAWCLLRGEDGG